MLDNAVEAGIIAFAPLMFAARFLPLSVSALRWVTRPVPRGLVPFWVGIGARHPRPAARVGRRRGPRHLLRPGRALLAGAAGDHGPALVVGHPSDPIHPAADAAMLAREMPNAEFVQATSILEWRVRPERLDRAAADFASACWDGERSGVRTRERQQGAGG